MRCGWAGSWRERRDRRVDAALLRGRRVGGHDRSRDAVPPAAVRLPVDPALPIDGGGRPKQLVPRGAMVAVASALGFFVVPALALVPPTVVWARFRMAATRRRRVREREIAELLPDAVDLLLLCTEAGWSLPVAHPQVAARLPATLGAALRAADAVANRGQPRSEALVEALSPLGDRARSLGHVLADHLHYGVALAPGLERLGSELRLDRRRRAELEARRVPVRLLGPLVVCILPHSHSSPSCRCWRPRFGRFPPDAPSGADSGAAAPRSTSPTEAPSCCTPLSPCRSSPCQPLTGSERTWLATTANPQPSTRSCCLGPPPSALLLAAWATKSDKITKLLNSVLDRVLSQVS